MRTAMAGPERSEVGQGPSTAALLAIALLWGVGSAVTKKITAPPLVGSSLRFCLTVPFVWGYARIRGRRISIARSDLPMVVVAGCLFGVNNSLIFLALRHTSVAVVSVCMALQPAVVLVAAGSWLGERPTRRQVVCTAVGVLGVVVVVLGGRSQVQGDTRGLVFAMLSVVAYSGYHVAGRRARTGTTIDTLSWLGGITLFAALTVTAVALLTSPLSDFRQFGGSDWAYVIYIAVGVTLVGHGLLAWVHQYVTASRSSVHLLLINVVAVVTAWPLNHEPITWSQATGGVVVLAAVAATMLRTADAFIEQPVKFRSPPRLEGTPSPIGLSAAVAGGLTIPVDEKVPEL